MSMLYKRTSLRFVQLFVLGIVVSTSAVAQVSPAARSESLGAVSVSAPRTLRPGQVAQIFITIPATGVDGISFELPRGDIAYDARIESYQTGPIEHSLEVTADGQRGVVRLLQPLSSAAVVIVSFKAAQLPSDDVLKVMPLVRHQGRLVEDVSSVVARRISKRTSLETSNRVLEVSRDKTVLELEERRLKNTDAAGPLTVSTWVRTTDIGGVILSAWTGDERDPYPFELLVGVDGSAVFYRGKPGEHQSMRSVLPVADGTWHHIAVTNDPLAQRSILFVDGVASDSLLTPFEFDSKGIRMMVGGRVPLNDNSVRRSGLFSGAVDDVGLWTSPLSRTRVNELARGQSGIRQQAGKEPQTARVGSPNSGFITSGAWPQPLIYQRFLLADAQTGRLPAFITLRQDLVVDVEPIHGFVGKVSAGAVELSWSSSTPDIAHFVLQRSGSDGSFRTIATLDSQTLNNSYGFVDPFIDEEVLYYRVVQVMKDQSTVSSPVIKLGVADLLGTGRELLLGNAPNPFSESTTIKYDLPKDGHVNISVWDLSGSPIRTLVDAVMQAGLHDVAFFAGELSAGTYFIRIQFEDQLESAKMLLVK